MILYSKNLNLNVVNKATLNIKRVVHIYKDKYKKVFFLYI